MLPAYQKYLSSFLHLFYPHNCEGCGTDIVYESQFLCARCMQRLPATGFFLQPGNPVAKLLYGRADIVNAGALYYFTKNSLLQHLLVQLKYKGNKEAGYFLGRMMGLALKESNSFSDVSALVPLPLNPKKEYIRGYNQATLICEGISDTWQKPVLEHAVSRIRFTETQTKQNRISRWQNMEGVFDVREFDTIKNKHILLIDDVITTGATLEACATALLKVEGVRLSIAAAAYTF